jgi:HEAT repeat protein
MRYNSPEFIHARLQRTQGRKGQCPIKRIVFLFLFSTLAWPALADEKTDTKPSVSLPAKTIEEQRLDTLRYGTETEIATLIQTLRSEKVTYLDKELIEIANKTRNRNIIAGIFSFFGEMEKSGLEDRAEKAIRDRDEEANETVLTAVDYLGKVRSAKSIGCLKELIDSGESRFLNTAFRALGRAGRGREDGAEGAHNKEQADEAASFLLDYYNNRIPGDENKREIIIALGETGSRESVSFLAELVKNNDERAVLRMAAIEAISKIGDNKGLDAVVEAVSSTDPNIRSSAVAALGPFSGDAVDNAILEAFRDSYYRTRIGAASAAGKRKLAGAIPFLRFRAANDEVPAVRDEAIKALGAINNSETSDILNSLFSERKNSDRVRILAADMLLQNNADVYSSRVIVEMDEAKNKNQTPLYNGFIRILSPAKSGSLEALARRFISGGGVIEKSLALDLILNNEFRNLADEVRQLLDEKKNGASLARKAKNTLEKLGLETNLP